MSTQHEVDVKPYGTRNDAGTQSFNTPQQTTIEIKPPYGSRNDTEVRSTNPQQTTAHTQGSRTDVEVKPYGSSEQQYQQHQRETVLKPQQQYSSYPQQQHHQQQQYTYSRSTQPLTAENLRNPLLATALGVTLALLLLSLSQIPKMASNWWHGKDQHHQDSSLQRTYDYWSRDRDYSPRDRDRDYSSRGGESWRDLGRDASWRGKLIEFDGNLQSTTNAR